MNVEQILDAARRRLVRVPREALGEYVQKRVLGIARAPRIVRRGDAWHVGALLIGADAAYAVGDILRARHEAPRGYTSESQRHRSELAAAAFRGGFAEGEVVHLGWQPIDLAAVARGEESGPLSVSDGVVHVVWSSSAAPVPLAGYLDDRIELMGGAPAEG